MIRQLFMGLLVLCLTMPAMAMPLHDVPAGQETACHGAAMADPAGNHGPPAKPDHAATSAGHHCIGCAPHQAAAAAPDKIPHARIRPARPMAVQGLARTGTGPDTPPPRS